MVLDPGTTYLTISCSPSDGGTLTATDEYGSTWTPTSNSETICDPDEGSYNLVVNGNNITVDSGTVNGHVTYTATPSEGYAFSHWTYKGVVLSNGNTPQTSSGQEVITAVFAVNSFSVMIASNDTSKGTVSPVRVNNVPNGTVIAVNGNTLDINGTTVTATPTSGHSFMGWTNVDGAVTADRIVVANFASSKTVTLENGHDYLLMSNGDVSVVSYANNVITFTHESPVDIIDLGKKGRTDGAHVTCCIDKGVYPVTDLIE